MHAAALLKEHHWSLGLHVTKANDPIIETIKASGHLFASHYGLNIHIHIVGVIKHR